MNKKYLLLIAVPLLAVTAGSAAYAYPQWQGKDEMASAIAKKFNLNSSEVQKFFDEHHTQMQAQKEEKHAEFIKKAVADGKLTQDQANKILAKKTECEAFRSSLQGKTREQANAAMQAHREELKKWAEENNIPIQYLMMGNGGMKGMGKMKGLVK